MMSVTLEHWLTPPVLLTALLLLVSFAWRSGKLGRRVVAGLLVLAGIAIAIHGFWGSKTSPTLSAATWPVAVLIVASLVLIAGRARAGTQPSTDGVTSPTRRVLGFSVAEHLCGVAVLFLLLVAIWLGEAPLGELADPSSPPPGARAPWFLLGWQEIGHYFQPWAIGWLPAVWLLALLALPVLDGEDLAANDAPSTPVEETLDSPPGERPVVAVVLFFWLVLGLYPMAVGAWLCRGPGEPGELHLAASAWGESMAWPLSEMLWNRWLAIGAPERWWIRELPGLLLLGLYFVALPLQLTRWKSTRGVFAHTRQRLGGPRYWLGAVLLLWMLLPPIKMYARWLLDLGPLIHLPELGLGL